MPSFLPDYYLKGAPLCVRCHQEPCQATSARNADESWGQWLLYGPKCIAHFEAVAFAQKMDREW